MATSLEAARGNGGAGALTGSPKGTYIFAAEGAAIVVIEPGAPTGPTFDPDVNFDTPRKKFQLGDFCPHVVRMALDPDADLDDGTTLADDGNSGYSNYLFVAAGRNGLWIVDADVDTNLTYNRIARVDDADLPGSQQSSDRQCSDVDFVKIGSTDYVVATFAAASSSQLRFYKLAEVRNVLGMMNGTGPETGAEIQPFHVVDLTVHPQVGLASTAQVFRSYASDLVVDQDSPAPGEAHMYVAMLTDGLVRVHVTETVTPTGITLQSAVLWGPVFGSGSHYAVVPAPTGPDQTDWYTNFNWVNQQTNPDLIERSDPPCFTNVALHRRDPEFDGHKLYAAVEPLGFVVFDVADPAAWGPTMPIDHHEGDPVDLQGNGVVTNPGAWQENIVVPESIVSGVSNLRELIGHVRGIEIVNTADGLLLLATYSSSPLIGNSPVFLEGFSYEDQFLYGAVSYWSAMNGIGSVAGAGRNRTRVFRVRDFPDASQEITLTEHEVLAVGGAQLFVPPIQRNQLGATASQGQFARLEFAHNRQSAESPVPSSMSNVCTKSIGMTSIHVGPPMNFEPIVAIRDQRFIAGRRTFGLNESLVNPDLIMTADNDGFDREGIPFLVGTPGNRSIEVDFIQPTGPANQDVRLATGVIMGRKSQWLDPSPLLGPNDQVVIAEGKTGPNGEPATYRAVVQTHPNGPGGTPPAAEFAINLEQVEDRWEETARPFYLGGMADQAYDEWVQQNVEGLEDYEGIFLFRQQSPDGLVYGRRDKLMDLLLNPSTVDGEFFSPADQEAKGLNMRTLNTHPEFDEFPWKSGVMGYAGAKAWYYQSASPNPYRQRVKTWEPELLRVRPSAGSDLDMGWLLVVPSGVAVLDSTEYPDLADVSFGVPYKRIEETKYEFEGDSFFGDPAWLPDPGSQDAQNFNHGMVLMWDFTNPSMVPSAAGRPPGSTTLPRIYLPIASEETPDPDDVGRSSFAWHLETVDVTLATKRYSYVVVGDFLGGVHCYEVSNILNGTAPVMQDSWYAPLGQQDVLTNNIRDVVLDRESDPMRVYVAVQRVGVVVLKLDISPTGAASFVEETILDDITEPVTMHLRTVAATGERLLYVCDSRQALRVYTSN